jgi:hypothetical protein
MLEAAGKDRDTGMTIIYNTEQKISRRQNRSHRRESVNKTDKYQSQLGKIHLKPSPLGKGFFLVSASGPSEDRRERFC